MMNTREAYKILRRYIRAEVTQKCFSGSWYWGIPGCFRDSLELTPNFREDIFENLPEVVKGAHAVWADAVWKHREQQGETGIVPQGGSLEDLLGKEECSFPWDFTK